MHHAKGGAASADQLAERIKVARGLVPADIVVRDAEFLDVFAGQWIKGDVAIADGVIVGIGDSYKATEVVDGRDCYLVPGFIDSHVHIESSMMIPARFAEAVLPRGTTTAIWDPHEIANVKGVSGIDWAIESTENLVLDVFVMAPSCVPSTSPEQEIETSGSVLRSHDLAKYVDHPRVLGLAEMMNWPGLLGGETDVMRKVLLFQGKVRDGHCPGLTGMNLNAYGVAGIHTCHESTTLSEASEKLSKGIHVLIREGSCAKDADALLPLLNAYTSATLGMCSDDRNPLDIEEAGHIDCIVNKALASGLEPIDIFRAASYAPARMYGLADRGAVAPGYIADLVLVKKVKEHDWRSGIKIRRVWKRGIPMHAQHLTATNSGTATRGNQPFEGDNIRLGRGHMSPEDFTVSAAGRSGPLRCAVIGVRPRQIVTDRLSAMMPVADGGVMTDLGQDIIKIAVLERHHASGRMGIGFAKGFGLQRGAIATSINHDCHNVIVTGSHDHLMAQAVELVRSLDGGIVVVHEDGRTAVLQLYIGGLMTSEEPEVVSEALRKLKALAGDAGCVLEEPFLQLSFLALPVIPSLKITDRGLIDGEEFQVISVIEG